MPHTSIPFAWDEPSAVEKRLVQALPEGINLGFTNKLNLCRTSRGRLVLRIDGTDVVREFSLDEFTPHREYIDLQVPKTKYRDARRIRVRVLPSGSTFRLLGLRG